MRRLSKAPAWLAVTALAVLAAACGGSASTTTTTTSTSPASAGTVWLCRPGTADDPCAAPLDATVVPPSGARSTVDPHDAADPGVDCFYVYPTVSDQRTDNADLRIQPAEIAAAMSQAAPFSSVCRVWAPMYRQRTEASLAKGLGGDPTADTVAYRSLLSGWTDYIDHDNDGRPVVFIGHSQGAAMLIRLLESQVDNDPAIRARTLSAIIVGGNVTVPTGSLVGATFRHLPLCTATGQTGCVIAYSTFPREPPADSLFGRPGQGVSLQSGQTATTGVQVACVNPASLAGGTAPLTPWFPTATSTPPPPPVTTPWVVYPDLYSATCASGGGATWLEVADIAGPGDRRPVVTEVLGPTWGYHLDDVNLALGDLVDDVRAQVVAYRAAHP
jgi:hypothetical protein